MNQRKWLLTAGMIPISEKSTFDYSKKVAASQGATPKSPTAVQQPTPSAGPRKSKPQPKGKKKGGKHKF